MLKMAAQKNSKTSLLLSNSLGAGIVGKPQAVIIAEGTVTTPFVFSGVAAS